MSDSDPTKTCYNCGNTVSIYATSCGSCSASHDPAPRPAAPPAAVQNQAVPVAANESDPLPDGPTLEEWLGQNAMLEHLAAFQKNGVDFDLLSDLSDSDLKELGVAKLGDRKKLLKSIAGLSKAIVPPQYAHLPKKSSYDLPTRKATVKTSTAQATQEMKPWYRMTLIALIKSPSSSHRNKGWGLLFICVCVVLFFVASLGHEQREMEKAAATIAMAEHQAWMAAKREDAKIAKAKKYGPVDSLNRVNECLVGVWNYKDYRGPDKKLVVRRNGTYTLSWKWEGAFEELHRGSWSAERQFTSDTQEEFFGPRLKPTSGTRGGKLLCRHTCIGKLRTCSELTVVVAGGGNYWTFGKD
jgi:hypothetical protein